MHGPYPDRHHIGRTVTTARTFHVMRSTRRARRSHPGWRRGVALLALMLMPAVAIAMANTAANTVANTVVIA